MTLCSKCKTRPAVLFVTRIEGDKSTPEGYCLKCAKELGIGPINDMLKQFNIPDEDLEAMSEQLMQFGGMTGDDDEDGDFSAGGAPSFPFLNELFGGAPAADNGTETDGKKDKKEKKHKKGENRRKYLSGYCTDLTARARAGELDKIIGRDRELSRVIQILSRRSKNNPCLIGEPGVGKTAIAEGLAQRIVSGDVPAALMDKEIHLLDLTALVAGTQFRGQFESRVKGLVDEVKREGNIILFIDEVHNMVGAGDSEGAMNAANILKPALSRGEIQVIGATTFKEYRKYIEKDAALERRFQPVTVEEPSIDDTVTMLIGVKGYYEQYHRVSVSDEVIRRAVTLSERYITDRFLPDKAIDLLDESCANCTLRNKEADRLFRMQKKLSELTEAENQIESQTDEVDYEQLANVRAQKAKLTEEVDRLLPTVGDNVVTDDDLAAVIEMWTGIPAAKIKESSLKKLNSLEGAIKSKIIGQDRAVDEVVAAVRRSRVQISPRRRPASFIFVGPTGVGKTELVKVLAKELFDSPETLIRLDMSEFMEKHSVSRIIGAPPGYVGYDEAGQLTEKVRRKPYSVLLFDEIEKAHPDVLNILLQILDDGRITDAQGRTVNFENTVIIMTSNAGSDRQGGSLGFGKTAADMTREKVMAALEQFLRPEFLGRVDEIIIFNALGYDELRRIAGLMLSELTPVLADKGITFRYSDEVCEELARRVGNAPRGAREMRRLVRKQVEDKIAALLVERCDDVPAAIAVTLENGEITLSAL